eukprot:TRINITY_DN68454_c0_g1_i3.p1 TRINITY_DN68454_c0_g1~~TRINITY_DN68454_c0_g1_i3.p1  ORF type:complete len:120 (-),score=23.51 TRINITY_DN68454_c0_g1_i3:28-387(-)
MMDVENNLLEESDDEGEEKENVYNEREQKILEMIKDRERRRSSIPGHVLTNYAYYVSTQPPTSGHHSISTTQSQEPRNLSPKLEREEKGVSQIEMEPLEQIGRAVQQECRDRSRMPSSA